MEYINPVLLLILIAEVCLGLCAWISPSFLRRVAAHLLTRADVLDVSREEHERRMKVWPDELGLNSDPKSANQHVPVHRFSRDEVKAS